MSTLVPSDEGRHRPGPEHDSTWSELSYLSWYDAATKIGGWHLVGFRPPEQHAFIWSTITHKGQIVYRHSEELPLPDDDLTNLSIGPVRLENITPFKCWRMSIDDKEFSASLQYDALMGPFGHTISEDSDVAFERADSENHYETYNRISGTVRIDGKNVAVNGIGLASHVWGLATDLKRFLAARAMWSYFGDDLVIHALHVTTAEGTREFGLLIDNGNFHIINRVEVDILMAADGFTPKAVEYIAYTDTDRGYHVTGKVDTSIPCAYRRIAVFAHTKVVYQHGGRVGSGFCEVWELRNPSDRHFAEWGINPDGTSLPERSLSR